MLTLDCKEMSKGQLDTVIKDYLIYLYEIAKENKVDNISIFNPDSKHALG